ncbi:Uncharacterised protein [Streptococcus pneumoniae]|nr:Uncharacterised protein [Streptococcus pneumoniae]CKM66955.1 Uncharacterised protein [Streptococcus pneumoniae]
MVLLLQSFDEVLLVQFRLVVSVLDYLTLDPIQRCFVVCHLRKFPSYFAQIGVERIVHQSI